MDAKFGKDVQAAGWAVQAVTSDALVAKCPNAGCNLFAELKYGVTFLLQIMAAAVIRSTFKLLHMTPFGASFARLGKACCLPFGMSRRFRA